MDHLTVCLITVTAAVISLIFGFIYGYSEGKKSRPAVINVQPQSTKSEVIKGHDVLVELGEDSNYTKQRIGGGLISATPRCRDRVD